jgi:hypothetical protein
MADPFSREFANSSLRHPRVTSPSSLFGILIIRAMFSPRNGFHLSPFFSNIPLISTTFGWIPSP